MKAKTVLHAGLLCGGLAFFCGGTWAVVAYAADGWLWSASLPATGLSFLLSLLADIGMNDEGPALPEIVVAMGLIPAGLVIAAAFTHKTSPSSPIAWLAITGAFLALGVVAHLFERPPPPRKAH